MLRDRFIRRVTTLAVATASAAILAVSPSPAWARPADDSWRTLAVGDGAFRVHYPAAAEAWTRQTAARLVAIRARLEEEIGYRPEQTIDVVVEDPLSRPNGSAWALLGSPRMVLWTTPPEPTSILGTYRDWGELVATHEEAHLVHLLRPSRNRWRRLAVRLLPLGGFGPLGWHAPRWVTEGYATLLEGRLTGTGRPHSDLVAAVLRQRALAGSLPSYGTLGGDDHTWLGRSMAYLVGSTYLTWLEEQGGPESLRHLWARMTARRSRSFDDAFRGVYGAGPAELYGRFTAELTGRAVSTRRSIRRSAPPPEQETASNPGTELPRRTVAEQSEHRGEDGALWLPRTGRTGAPAVSPDGARLAVVLRDRDVPPRLAVFATTDDPEAAAERAAANRKLLARDPEDVPAVAPEAQPRKPMAVLATRDGRAPTEPRWSADGRSLLYVASGPDAAGRQRFDLFRWTPGAGSSERITHQADLRSPDPAPPLGGIGGTGEPDGGEAGEAPGWAVAVRIRYGQSQLVRVDLGSGAVTPLTEPSVTSVWATPRISPDGRRLAAVRNREGRWELVLFALQGPRTAGGSGGDGNAAGLRELTVVPTPGDLVADPAWGTDGKTLYAAVGDGGSVDLFAFAVGGGDDRGSDHARGPGADRPRARRLTRTVGAALAPAPVPSGPAGPDGDHLFFLSLEAGGLDVRRLDLPPHAADSEQIAEEAGAWPAPEESPETAHPRNAATDRLRSHDSGPAAGPGPTPSGEAAEALPPSVPYRFGPRSKTPVAGFALSPAGAAFEAGLAGTDPVGRLSWLALGAVASGGEASGAVLGASFRAPPFTTSVQLFTAEPAPAEQPGRAGTLAPAAAGGALDVTRRGVAVEELWQRRYAPLTLRLSLGLAAGQVTGPATPGGSEDGGLSPLGSQPGRATLGTGSARLGGGLFLTPSRGRWQGLVGLDGRLEQGETGGDGWRRTRTGLTAGLFRDGQGLRVAWSRRGSSDLRHAFDLYQVGGVRRSVLPELADGARVIAPALGAGALVGSAVETQRIELTGGLLPGPLPESARLVWTRYRADDGTRKGAWLELAGVELSKRLGPLPLLGLPAAEIDAGAAYLLSGPDEGDVRFWAALSWRP